MAAPSSSSSHESRDGRTRVIREEQIVESQDADVWWFTEVGERSDLPGFDAVWTDSEMAPRRRWAAIFAREGRRPLPQPHAATAAASLAGGSDSWSSPSGSVATGSAVGSAVTPPGP
jgi:hypothetical protein